MDLSLELQLDDQPTNIQVLSGTTIPIPLCNEDAAIVLPGDGTIGGFARALGENVGQTAVELVLKHIGLEVCLCKINTYRIIYYSYYFQCIFRARRPCFRLTNFLVNSPTKSPISNSHFFCFNHQNVLCNFAAINLQSKLDNTGHFVNLKRMVI